jgi:hypothetical protein
MTMKGLTIFDNASRNKHLDKISNKKIYYNKHRHATC